MSKFQTDRSFEVLNVRPEHFTGIQELCRKVYPFSKPWSTEQLESHRSYFPGGQLVVIDSESKNVVGLAFSLIISWDDYSPQDNWADFTSGGFFHNHNPKKGKTLYGAEVMVDPELRGLGIGKMLYLRRQEIVQTYGLKRIRAGARLRGYSKFKDTHTPREYVIQVIEKKIFDPTLSFQLNQGFVVLDVAKNYLFNDPESLGYAAVIEWLNPQVATAIDNKKQKDTVESFLANKKFIPEFLPRELYRLVRKTTFALGDVIRESEGQSFYESVEHFRVNLKKMRGGASSKKLAHLMKDVEKKSASDQFKIAHAFALHLVIVNACETAYRTWRQRLKPLSQGLNQKIELKFVLTAHPTEARSPIVIEILQKITDLLVDGLNNNFAFNEKELLSHVRFLWKLPLSKQKTPTVLDEAEFMFSLVFSKKVFDFLVGKKSSYNLLLRTWVGGDKDGHPGVNAKVMKSCLELSRSHILKILQEKLKNIIADLESLGSSIKNTKANEFVKLLNDLEALKKLSTGDGNRIKKWTLRFHKILKNTSPLVCKHHEVLLIQQILNNFPALVLPIELREDAEKIRVAIQVKDAPIRQMLREIRVIAGALGVTSYARGMVISHCESSEDIQNAQKLAWVGTRTKSFPIIPLFESKEALKNGRDILKSWLQDKTHMEQVQRHWAGYLEIMLGYSDSSKEIGVFPSRLLIQKSMTEIASLLASKKIKPIFFHGSGGSVARGGGSLKEQVSWWPNAAIERPKITIQGEMVQRLFATKEILNAQCIHLRNESLRRKSKKVERNQNPILQIFSKYIEAEYKKIILEPKILEKFLSASPFKYLDQLNIGSRPSKRKATDFSISSLRAIPWVLCWTQTRSLLPTWWGVGTAWALMSEEEKMSLKAEFTTNPFLSSFVKSLGFTLAKVELNVWKLYFKDSIDEALFKKIEAEFTATKEFVFTISGEKTLVWHRPWLEESIRLRAPHVHILNVLQILAMQRNDEALLKETIVGIACGMLTTG